MIKNYTPVHLNDIPRHTPWVGRILGTEPWKQKKQTRDEVYQQYERETWKPLLEKFSARNELTLEEVDEAFYSSPSILCSSKGEFFLAKASEANRFWSDLLDESISPFLPAPAICEIGCGYGTALLNLAMRSSYKGMDFIGAEFSESALSLFLHIAGCQNISVQATSFDITDTKISDLEIQHDSIIFTTSVLTCVPDGTEDFLEWIISCRPKAVLHMECCHEHHLETTLGGLLVRRYLEINGYNKRIMTLLKNLEDQGKIEILEETPSLFGFKLLPHSRIVWRPR
jgi:SAM-dependent methyltransferase